MSHLFRAMICTALFMMLLAPYTKGQSSSGMQEQIKQTDESVADEARHLNSATSDTITHERGDQNSTDTTDSSVVIESETKPTEEIDRELIYSVNRTPEPPFNTARAVKVITRDDIRRKNARTLPEVLMEEAGIFVQQTNYGGGSPIIRGLVGKQILILVDGVKLNNATYRFGPVQYLNTIDLNLVERIEIVRGVGSVLGSDALGGTINIITKKGPATLQNMPIGGSLFSRYSSADNATTLHGEIFGQSNKLRYTAGATHRSTEDVKAGEGMKKQAATAYHENAANASLDWFLTGDRTISFSYLALEQNDVPRTDRITDGTNLVFEFDPQRVQLAKLTYQDLTTRSWTDFMQLTAYFNRQDEDRQEIRPSSPNVERRLSDSQIVLGLNLELGSFVSEAHRLIYGIDYATEKVHSTRYDLNRVTGVSSPKRGNYTDHSTYDTFAFYVQDRFNAGAWLTTTLGARYSRFAADGRENSSAGVLDLKSSDDAITGTINLVFHLTPNLNLITNATRGYRAPNLDDISVFDERTGGTEVPNTNLSPERISTYLTGFKYSTAKFSGSAFYHYSRLANLLVRSPGSFQGLSFIDRNGNGVHDALEPNVLQKKNIGKSTVDGIELDARYVLDRHFTVWGNYTWTEGDDDLANEPLSKIPPAFGALGVRWFSKTRRELWAELVYHFAASQTRLSSGDKTDSRIGPAGTSGFNVFTLRSGMLLIDKFRMTAAVENLFDEKYKYHGSGVFRPGRQLVVGGEFSF